MVNNAPLTPRESLHQELKASAEAMEVSTCDPRLGTIVEHGRVQ